jgi:hypothetical protein
MLPPPIDLTTWRRDVAGLSLAEAAQRAHITQRLAVQIEANPHAASAGALLSYIGACGGVLTLTVDGPRGQKSRVAL